MDKENVKVIALGRSENEKGEKGGQQQVGRNNNNSYSLSSLL